MTKDQIISARTQLKEELARIKDSYLQEDHKLKQKLAAYAPFQPADRVRVHQKFKKTSRVTECVVTKSYVAFSAKYEWMYDMKKLKSDGTVGDPMRLHQVEKIELVSKGNQ